MSKHDKPQSDLGVYWSYFKGDMSHWDFFKWAISPAPIDRSTLPRIASVSSTLMKFFEPDECAQCGAPPDSELSLNKDGPGPAFCSTGCLHRAMSRYLDQKQCGKEQDPEEWLQQWQTAMQKVHLSWLEMSTRKLEQENAKREAEHHKQLEAEQRELEQLEAEAAEIERAHEIANAAISDLKLRMEHTFFLSGAGGGKTTMLQIYALGAAADNESAQIIILDPKGTLENSLARLKIFNTTLRDRLIVINPLHFAPSCSPFYSAKPIHK